MKKLFILFAIVLFSLNVQAENPVSVQICESLAKVRVKQGFNKPTFVEINWSTLKDHKKVAILENGAKLVAYYSTKTNKLKRAVYLIDNREIPVTVIDFVEVLDGTAHKIATPFRSAETSY